MRKLNGVHSETVKLASSGWRWGWRFQEGLGRAVAAVLARRSHARTSDAIYHSHKY